MSEETKIITPEQEAAAKKEAADIKFAEGQSESLIFMRRNLDFKPGPANAKKMGELLQADGLELTVPNLEKLFLEHQSEFELNPKPVVQPPLPPVSEEIVVKNEGPDSGIPAEITRSVLIKMTADEWKAVVKKYGEAAVMVRRNRRN